MKPIYQLLLPCLAVVLTFLYIVRVVFWHMCVVAKSTITVTNPTTEYEQ